MAEVIQSHRSPSGSASGGRSSSSIHRSDTDAGPKPASSPSTSSSNSNGNGNCASMTHSSSMEGMADHQNTPRRPPLPSPSSERRRPALSHRATSSSSSSLSRVSTSSSSSSLRHNSQMLRTLSDELSSDRSNLDVASGSTTPTASTNALPMSRRRSSDVTAAGPRVGSVSPRPPKRMSRTASTRSIGLVIAMSPDPSSSSAPQAVRSPSSPRGPPPREALPDPYAGPSSKPATPTTPTAPASQPSSRGHGASLLALLVAFFRDILRTWSRIVHEVLLPFSSDFLGIPASPTSNLGKTAQPSLAQLSERLEIGKTRRSFAERFKYAVVTSFLLTATLSISRYGSEDPVEDQATAEEERSLLAASMPISSSIVTAVRHSRPTPRQSFATILRNSFVWAVAILWLYSPTTQQWFRTTLLLSCSAWTLALLLNGKSSFDKRSPLRFELVQPSSNCVPSPSLSTYLQERTAHTHLQAGVKRLVKTACSADIELNRSLAALQEIELVARGFKVGGHQQQPMPPISRIEAASPPATSYRPGLMSAQSPVNGKRSVSSMSAESGVKHGSEQDRQQQQRSSLPVHRMLHLRTALARSFVEAEQASKDFTAILQPLADQDELALLGDMYSLDRVQDESEGDESLTAGSVMGSKRAPGLASPPLLSSARFATMTPTGHGPHRRNLSLLTGASAQPTGMPNSTEWGDDCFNSPLSNKRGSWTNTLPRSFGSTTSMAGPTHQRKASNIALAPMMLAGAASPAHASKSAAVGDEAPLSASSSSSASASGKRYSNDSVASSSQMSSSAAGLSRSGSLLKNRNGDAISFDPPSSSAATTNSHPPSAAAAAIRSTSPPINPHSPNPNNFASPGRTTTASNPPASRSGSRLSYISEASSSSGPNGSPAAKRLSYQHQAGLDGMHIASALGGDSRPGSRMSVGGMSANGGGVEGSDGAQTLLMAAPKHYPGSPPLSASSSSMGPSSPFHWQQQQANPSMSSPSAASTTIGRAGSLRGVRRALFTAPGIGATEGPSVDATTVSGNVDPLSLLGLRGSFEHFHLVRRRGLCLLLALCFGSKKYLGEEAAMQEYWRQVSKAMHLLTLILDGIRTRMAKVLDQEMNVYPHGEDLSIESQPSSSIPGSQGLLPFTGLDDRSEALISSLRSIQVKIRACNEELRMDSPAISSGLHGGSPSHANGGSDVGASVSQRKENAERLWDSVREDLLAITQEWEGGCKVFKADRARAKNSASTTAAMTTSPSLGSADTSASSGRLESPLEAEEDERDAHKQQPGGDVPDDQTSYSHASHADESDDNLATSLLRLRSASASPLPGGRSESNDSGLSNGNAAMPHGLEQIFESIAGIAVSLQEEREVERRARKSGKSGTGGDVAKTSREERIARVKEQRKELERRRELGLPLELPSDTLGEGDAVRGTKPHGGVVTELKDVLQGIRIKREKQRDEAEAALAKLNGMQEATCPSSRTAIAKTSGKGESSADSGFSNLTLAATSTSHGSSSHSSSTAGKLSSTLTPSTSNSSFAPSIAQEADGDDEKNMAANIAAAAAAALGARRRMSRHPSSDATLSPASKAGGGTRTITS